MISDGVGTVRLVGLTLASIGLALMAEPSPADTSSAERNDGFARAQADSASTLNEPTNEDDTNRDLMIGYVLLHDAAILEGLLPPPFGTVGELIEFGSNIFLKYIPPYLVAPPDLQVDPRGAPGPGYSVDGCGIDFELLSAQASYANVFGPLNIREPYRKLTPENRIRKVTKIPWQKIPRSNDPNAETRWGFLRAPLLYHANTDVSLEIQTPYTVQRYDQATELFDEPRVPIDTFAESPQQVYLPIGDHPIGWYATAELSYIFDIGVPIVAMATSILSELKVVNGGVKVLKKIKKSGIPESVVDEPLEAAEVGRIIVANQKFNDVWMKAFEDGQVRRRVIAARKARQKLWKELKEDIAEKVGFELAGILFELGQQGYGSIDGDTRDEIKRLVGKSTADIIEIARCVYDERYGDDFVERPSPGPTPPSCSGNSSISTAFMIRNLADNAVTIIRRALQTCGAECVMDLLTRDTAFSAKVQTITVWDSVPPTINIDPTPIVLEATDFGGTRLYRVREQLLELAESVSSDNCGRTPIVALFSPPELLPLGPQQVIVQARDRGPNPDDGQDYSPRATINIIVEDTQPPLLLAPPSKVILDTADVALADAKIGAAVTVDLADVQPKVTNDAPAGGFPVNSRTPIQWVATDGSGNAAEAFQLITVKASNTPPTANSTSATARTAEPEDITLTAFDLDELDNQFDPLFFKIVSQPENGEFIAPLLPFFIEDYRTRPNDGLGEDFDPIVNLDVNVYVARNFCDRNDPDFVFPDGDPPRNFVHEPRYVHVTDDGIRYVLDEFFFCQDENGKADTELRFSKWSAAGDYLGQSPITTNTFRLIGDAFRVDRDGFLYYNTIISESTSSAVLGLVKCSTEGWTDSTVPVGCTQATSWTGGELGSFDSDDSYARIDTEREVIYVVAAKRLRAYDFRDGQTRLLGEIGPKDANGVVLDDWFGKIPSLEVGSDGSLYANDVERDRIHKIGPVTLDENGELVPGDYIGWAGKCTASGFGDCDIDVVNPERGRSFGYSCTWENVDPNDPVPVPTCTATASSKSACDPDESSFNDVRAGCRQGQFNTPKYISIDPNDILYVADFENARVQRFSPDGSFAGEAVSEGSGVNRGERPGFILGNMGQPESVSVNSSQFYVVDRLEKFVYVFGTLPFKDVKESTEPGATMEATVTYVSDQKFPNPNVTGEDRFSFSVSDGLDTSPPAEVRVTVDRAFRPPQAASVTIKTAEDTPIEFELPAGDPDGVIGKDPLGLDTLTYRLVRRPENGRVSGYGESWTYTPAANFSGEDSLSFKVNDGVDDSNEGVVTFNVTPVNDPPAVMAEEAKRVALGFPTLLQATFTDDLVDGSADNYEASVDWGDGSEDLTGDLLDGDSDAGIDGVLVVAPMDADAEGRAIADHTYDEAGERTVEVCVTDSDGLEGCGTTVFDVKPLVVLAAGGIFYQGPLDEDEITLEEVPDGTDFTFEVMAVNGEPETGDGLPAEDVVLDLLLPDGLTVDDIEISRGSCTQDGSDVSCAIGTLDAGAEVELTMTARGPGSLIYDESREFEGTIRTSSAALNAEEGLFVDIELIADTTDTDGDGMSDTFENTFGLDPAVDDAAGDLDGDGLANIDEYNNESSPVVADTDGDGVTDGDEVLAGTDPLFDDIPPDLTIPADIEVDATGVLTLVELGDASANDGKDGPVEAIPSNTGPFRPGRHAVAWNAYDESGNRAEAFQFVNVVPQVNFQVDQSVSEGYFARVRVELNGPAVNYPVTVPFEIGGTTVNPNDHDAVDGEAVIASGVATEIEINIATDLVDEPDETIELRMGTPTNAVAGDMTAHTITVTEQNFPPRVMLGVEQQGRPTTTIARDAGLIALIADVRDDPAQNHLFDWSTSDSALIDAPSVNDPAYLLEPAGLVAGLYDMRVSVTDDGLPPLNSVTSSLLNVADEQLVLKSGEDTDGDGESNAAEGPDDNDGDRIANYLDDIDNSNLLRLAADGGILETATGLNLRLGATAFGKGDAYPRLEEQELSMDTAFGYSSDVLDFEITRLEQRQSARIVVPLRAGIPAGSVYRTYTNGQWQGFIENAIDGVESAPGRRGACPPAEDDAYEAGLTAEDGCLRLTLTDGGPNDLDGLADGVIRMSGGLAVPISANGRALSQTSATLVGDGEAVMARFQLQSDSGDIVLNSLTLEAGGNADELEIDDVVLVLDAGRDGEWNDEDIVLADGQYTEDNGTLTLFMNEPFEVPVGDTNLLVVYIFGDTDAENDDEQL